MTLYDSLEETIIYKNDVYETIQTAIGNKMKQEEIKSLGRKLWTRLATMTGVTLSIPVIANTLDKPEWGLVGLLGLPATALVGDVTLDKIKQISNTPPVQYIRAKYYG